MIAHSNNMLRAASRRGREAASLAAVLASMGVPRTLLPAVSDAGVWLQHLLSGRVSSLDRENARSLARKRCRHCHLPHTTHNSLSLSFLWGKQHNQSISNNRRNKERSTTPRSQSRRSPNMTPTCVPRRRRRRQMLAPPCTDTLPSNQNTQKNK